jgi:hypothetical protein
VTLVARDTAEDLVIARLARRLQRIAATLGEHDRLAAFLDEARTAKIVIGESDEDAAAEAPLPSSVRMARTNIAAVNEAARLDPRRRVAAARSPESDRLVSTVACSHHLREGFVFVIAWSARAIDGDVVDREPLILHVPQTVPRMRPGAALARRMAAEAVERWGEAIQFVASRRLEDRLASVSAEHAAIVGRMIDREQALAHLTDPIAPLQPGLFDRRAVRRADEARYAQETTALEHQRRIALLQRSIDLEARCDSIGVLIVRGRR